MDCEVTMPPGSADDLATSLDGALRPRLPFPVIGIGASAGGVEVPQRFFAAVPAGESALCIHPLHRQG